MVIRADWRKLLMVQYAVDPSVLRPFTPPGTEPDFWNGQCYVSLVGFLFLESRLQGIPIPFHQRFEEVNLRLYVRHFENGTWKRGVAFIREIVPKPAVQAVANGIFHEHYLTRPMRHVIVAHEDTLEVTYGWKTKRWNTLGAVCARHPETIPEGSEEEFFTEHYWGYTQRRDGHTLEYAVEHPRWSIYPVRSYHVDASFRETYGDPFGFLDHTPPSSVLLAEGSPIKLVKTKRLRL